MSYRWLRAYATWEGILAKTETACWNCDKPYRKDRLIRCPSCGSHQTANPALLGDVHSDDVTKAATAVRAMSSELKGANTEGIEQLLREIVISTSKTTHAVRAFVRFLFIQLSATTLAGLVIISSNLFSTEPNDALFFFGVLIYIGGVVWSSKAGWDELSQSD